VDFLFENSPNLDSLYHSFGRNGNKLLGPPELHPDATRPRGDPTYAASTEATSIRRPGPIVDDTAILLT